MSFTFGASAGQKPAFGFGAPAATTAPAGFGAAPAPAFGFGAPATSSAPPAFGFGGAPAATAAPAFGFGGTTTSTAAAPAFGGFGAASTAAPAFGLGGGTMTSTAPAFGFGATTASTAPAFGGFGAGTATSSAPPAFGFAGGAPTTSTSAFGAAAPPAFGAFGATNTAPVSGSLNFGAPAATGAFGAPATSAPAFGFGGAAPTATSTGFGAFGAPAVSTATSLGFGTAASSASQPGFGLGGSAFSTAPATSLGGSAFGGLGGFPASQTGISTAATTSTTTGLGGTQFPPFGSGSAPTAVENKSDAKALKETAIPNELFQGVEEFKKYVKEEKSISSDIVHMSPKIHDKITSETDGLRRLVAVLSSELSKQKHQLEKLKKDISEGLLNAEIAQRTRDAPPGLQFENVAPQEYFMRIVNNFEHQMVNFRRQIEETEQHLQSMMSHPGVTPQHLMSAIRKQHEAFVSLAAKYQPYHESAKQQKEIFSNLHRQRYGTNPNLFAERLPSIARSSSSSVPTTVGPSPFTDQMDGFSRARASMAARPQNQGLPGSGPPTLSLGGASGGALGSNPSANYGSSFGGNQSSLFAGSANPNTSAFGGQSSFFPSSTTSGFNSSALGAPSTPGVFGSTMSPFANNNTSSIFQTSGKRGKH